MVKGVEGALGQPRIRIFQIKDNTFMQMTCLQCIDAACEKVCPVAALKRNELTGAIEVIDELCVGCGLCEAACPFGHIALDKESGSPLKCDLCGGNPACARFCPDRALEMR